MSRTKSAAPYLRALNAAQRRAAEHTLGPVLVLAGAGTGKTTMIVHRIVHLMRAENVDAGAILAVTFTNKAADEMRERVRRYAGESAARVAISTFHALGARMLREHGERLGLPRRFAIYASGDQLGALRAVASEVTGIDDRYDLKRVLRRISDWKNRGLDPDAARRRVRETRATNTRADDYAVLAADAYPRYEETLRASGAVDFDDLLLLPVRLLREDEAVCRALWRRWQYIMIDEYQDTNAVQLELVRLLAGSRRNVCVVGDDDQSIYAFRGADVSNILEFERHFPGAAVIRLEQNYRSTQRILAAANAVIAGNARRHAKRLRTENALGVPIDLWQHADDAAEADALAKDIAVRRYGQARRWRDFAILYRTNPQARPFEEALRTQGVPYRVVGATSFFDRKEVADALAYLRAIAHPHDELALRRIINYPARGIGRTTVLRIAEHARAQRVPFIDALAEPEAAGIGGAPASAIRELTARLDAARASLAAAERLAGKPPPAGTLPPLAQWARGVFADFGLEDAVREETRDARSADARVDNLRDLVGTIARYERRLWDAVASAPALHEGDDAGQPPTLVDALARLTLAELDDRGDDDGRADVVTLMTLHSAKGLEFGEVYLAGLEEGILPHARTFAVDDRSDAAASDSDAGLAEERRLLYVGMTRARQRLVLSHCALRRRAGQEQPALPSRYLEAVPTELIEVRTAATPPLNADESAALRQNFFRQMRESLAPEPADEAG